MRRRCMPRPEKTKTYTVTMRQVRYQDVNIEASSEQEAKRQAQEMIEARHPWRFLKNTRWSNGKRWKYGPVNADMVWPPKS
jgi:hypothetical protein